MKQRFTSEPLCGWVLVFGVVSCDVEAPMTRSVPPSTGAQSIAAGAAPPLDSMPTSGVMTGVARDPSRDPSLSPDGNAAAQNVAGNGMSGSAGNGSASPQEAGEVDVSSLPRFSFFVASSRALIELSGNQQGFGGDLRFGETGEGAGLRGADKICQTIADSSMPGAGRKGWRALLSATAGAPGGGPVHAIDRIGAGPWYDRLGRLVSTNKADMMQVRPASADPLIKDDLPNEDGVPNHDPDLTGPVDNHHVLTGSDFNGQLCTSDPRVTCNDWTKAEGDANDAPRVGLSWPRGAGRGMMGMGFMPPPFPTGGASGGGFPPPGMPAGYIACDSGSGQGAGGGAPANWLSSLNEAGCAPGVGLVEMGPPREENPTVGSGGGYGGIYCFALMP